jgi:Putative collagen-binding domain of a collagenase
MEHLPPLSFVARDHPLSPDDPGYVASRTAMGQTRRFAERVNLAAMTPRGELASSGYCLADPEKEYLIYLPSGGGVTADLSAARGELAVEWFDPGRDKGTPAGTVAGGARREFKAPFTGAAVLYLAARPTDAQK